MPKFLLKTNKLENVKYKETAEWKTIWARHEKLKESGGTSILELERCHEHVHGGIAIVGNIKDIYGNVVFDTKDPRSRISFGTHGVVLRYDKEESLPYIYAVLHCPIVSQSIIKKGQPFNKMVHQFYLSDIESESLAYAERMEEDMEYKRKIYDFEEGVINFLCTVTAVPTNLMLGVKKARLCTVWDSDNNEKADEAARTNKEKLKEMIDSPDMLYYQVVYSALSEGNATKREGVYKTQQGVYKHNEQILGNSIENVVSYFKTNDEVFIAYRKNSGANTEKATKKPK